MDSPSTLNDLLPTTPDLREERLAELKRLFPDLFTNEGRLDPDELKRLVAPNEVHEAERYEFKWYGKAASKREAFTPTTATLVYDEDRSVNPEKADGNMIIEGENLETLKLLLAAYREQVKVIYIDPPYNTGKDFIYKDNYAKDRKSYWEETGSAEEGVKLSSNPDTSGRFHSDWLSMIQSRLLASRGLLCPEGYLVVSIDDAEMPNMTRLLDEAFGKENRVAVLVWDKNRKNDAKFFSVGHEYMLVYAKDKNLLKESDTKLRAKKEGVDEVRELFDRLFTEHGSDFGSIQKELLSFYKTIESDDPRKAVTRFRKVDAKGPYRDDGNINWPGTGGPRYTIHHPLTKKPCKVPRSGWRYPTEDRFWEEYNAGRIVFGPDETTVPSVRTNLFEQDDQVLASVHYSYAQTASDMFDRIFGMRVFDHPKHFDDLRLLVEYLSNPGELILDFFGGSGSLAHGVLEANRRNSSEGNQDRQFIVVQIPEVVDSGSTSGANAVSVGLPTVASITIERVKRVIEGYGDNPQPIPDTGFRVYKLAKSNFPRCEFVPDPALSEEENVAALQRYIQEKEASYLLPLDEGAEQAIFDEVLLKCGFQLHYTRTLREDFTENTVYQITDGRRGTLACLAWNEGIKDATLKRLRELDEAGEKPFFICLERALSTTTKWNLSHLLGKRLTAF